MEPLIAPRTDFSIEAINDDWMVVGKPAPLIVHPTNGREEITLLGELKKRWPQDEFHFINRLDRETSGCVLVAKSKKAARIFGKLMMRRQIHKKYLAIVHGWPTWDEILVDRPLLRMGEIKESPIWVRQMVHDSGKASVTQFELKRQFRREGQQFAMVEAQPQTGRTHQIRVHLESLGHVIVGDKIYARNGEDYLEFIESGWNEELQKRSLLSRHALHSSMISFQWEGKAFEVCCPLPGDLEEFSLGLSEKKD